MNKDWEQRELGSISKIGSSRRIHKKDYVDYGIPFFRGSEISKLGSSSKLNNVLYISEEYYKDLKEKNGVPQIGDILITAVGTLGNLYLVKNNIPFYFKDGNLILLSDIKIDSQYLNIYLSYGEGQKRVLESSAGSNQKALTMVKLKNVIVPIPNSKEQVVIGELFEELEKTINLHQRKYVNLVKLKNVYLEKIFNQQLVFEDGKNDWKEIKFNEFMYKPKNLLKAKNIGKNELLTVKLFGKGVTIANQNRALKLGATTYYKRYAGDFIYGKQNFFNGAFGFIDKNLDGYYSSGDVPTLKFNSEIIDRYFFLSYISRENYYKRAEAYSSGTGSKRIHEDTLLDFKIKAPIISEQRKIAILLCEIDDLINDYSQRLKYLSDIKSLYLNKMFI